MVFILKFILVFADVELFLGFHYVLRVQTFFDPLFGLDLPQNSNKHLKDPSDLHLGQRIPRSLPHGRIVEQSSLYGTQRLVTLLTRAHNYTVSPARLIQSLPSHSVSFISTLI